MEEREETVRVSPLKQGVFVLLGIVEGFEKGQQVWEEEKRHLIQRPANAAEEHHPVHPMGSQFYVLLPGRPCLQNGSRTNTTAYLTIPNERCRSSLVLVISLVANSAVTAATSMSDEAPQTSHLHILGSVSPTPLCQRRGLPSRD